MQTTTPAVVAQAAVKRLPRAALLGLCVVYVLAGFIGRGGWKSADMAALGFMAELAAGRSNWWHPTLLGIASGFTSQVAHAGQPPFQIYVLPRRLPRDVLVGTTAIFFAAVNWIKVPAYWALGQFNRETLGIAALLLPVAISSTFAGVWLVRRVSPARFYTAIYALMVVVGIKLIWDALA